MDERVGRGWDGYKGVGGGEDGMYTEGWDGERRRVGEKCGAERKGERREREGDSLFL